MGFLLDTHAFLWFVTGDPRLSAPVRQIIEDPTQLRYVSVASCWEITIKYSRGRLEFGIPLERLFTEIIEEDGFRILGVEPKHLLKIPALPSVHGDPFDRLMIAQCQAENLALLSNDQTLDGYDIDRIW